MVSNSRYGDGLAEALGIRPNNGDSIFNPAFEEWEILILAVAGTSFADIALGQRYQKERAAGMLQKCMSHARAHKNGNSSKKVLCLVHPFYLSLADFNYLMRDSYREENKAYLTKVADVLKKANSLGIETVLFETAHHYASISSLLAEQELFSQVIFTESNDGIALNRHQQESLLGRELYFAGCYNRFCLTTAMGGLLKKGQGRNKISALPELILEGPYFSKPGPSPVYPSSLIPNGGIEIATTRSGTSIYLPEDNTPSIDEFFTRV